MFPDENTRRGWMNLASEHVNLRFPTLSVSVMTPFNMYKRGKINFETLVASKDKKLLVLVRDSYEISSHENIVEVINQTTKRFNAKCELTKDKYIFNNHTAIREPFEINKL